MKRLYIVLFVLILAACGGNETPAADVDIEATVQAAIAATQAAQPTNTPLPTDTPTLEPTPTPKPTATPEPTNTPTPKPPTATPTPYQPRLADIEPLGCKEDEFQGITWCSIYNTDDIEDHVLSDTDPSVDVAIYVGIKGKNTFLRWNIDYVGDDWIFIDQITFLVDGKRYEVPVDEYDDITTDVCCGGKVFEYFDRLIDDTTLLLLIGASDEAKVRLSGKGGYIDHAITDRETIIIGRALATYEKNGGRFQLNLN